MSIVKKLVFSLIFSLNVLLLSAQNEVVNFACSYTSNKVNEKAICDMLGFKTRPEAQRAVEKIVSRSGLKQNFYVMECPNIDNCFAATRNGERLIVYDGSFMRRVNSMTQTDWGAMSVLSHEIGHHLQGHTLKPGGSDPSKELEADEFSGFVMYQMGASLKEAQSAIWKLTTDYDSGSHPPRKTRMQAIKTGYTKAKELYPRVNGNDNYQRPNEEKEIKGESEQPKVIVTKKPETLIKTGCLEGNCFNGYGVAVNRKSLEKYAGNWKNGRRSGYGIEFYKDGTKKYEGDFEGSNFEGYGTYFFKNGDRYVGRFKNNLKSDDKAVYYYRNGDRLFVRYVNDKKEGRAKIVYFGGTQGQLYFENDIEK